MSLMSVDVWHGSITDADVDVLVNASNTILRLGTGVSGAIARACGPEFQTELTELLHERWPQGLEPGQVVITGAGAHPRASHVAHVAVMDYREGSRVFARPNRERIEVGARNLWDSLKQMPTPVSIGMVALGAGTGGMGLRESVGIACRTLLDAASSGPGSLRSVQFVAYDHLEFANTAIEVAEHFPIDFATLDPEAQELIRILRDSV